MKILIRNPLLVTMNEHNDIVDKGAASSSTAIGSLIADRRSGRRRVRSTESSTPIG